MHVKPIIEDSTWFDQCIEKGDRAAVVHNTHLFWLAYCKGIFSNQVHKDDFFRVSIKEKEIRVFAPENNMKKTKEMVEKIREVFAEGLEKKQNITLVAVNTALQFTFVKESPKIILDEQKLFTCPDHTYYKFLHRVFPVLGELCGATYSEDSNVFQMVKFSMRDRPESMNTHVMHIDWQSDFHRIYPISPMMIVPKQDVNQLFYSLYQQEKLCDFSIMADDENPIRIHSVVLYSYGGPVLQNALTAEGNAEKTLSFKGVSQETTYAFIDFLYLGGAAFIDKTVEEKTLSIDDLFSLFTLANEYQIAILVDCCTNMISLFATVENVESIQRLAERYDNGHLRMLLHHFSPAHAV